MVKEAVRNCSRVMKCFLISAFIGFNLFVVAGEIRAREGRSETGEVPVFRLLGLGTHGSDLCYRLGDIDVPVVFAEDFRSPFYQRPEGGSLHLYTMEEKADGTMHCLPVLTVALPEQMKFPLVVIFKAGSTLAARLLDDGEQAFPGGAYRILNQLDHDIGVALGKSRKLVRRGEDELLADEGGEQRTRQVQLFRSQGDHTVLLFSNNWAFSEFIRTLVLVTPSSGETGFPSVRRIVEPVNTLSNPVPVALSTNLTIQSNPQP